MDLILLKELIYKVQPNIASIQYIIATDFAKIWGQEEVNKFILEQTNEAIDYFIKINGLLGDSIISLVINLFK